MNAADLEFVLRGTALEKKTSVVIINHFKVSDSSSLYVALKSFQNVNVC